MTAAGRTLDDFAESSPLLAQLLAAGSAHFNQSLIAGSNSVHL